MAFSGRRHLSQKQEFALGVEQVSPTHTDFEEGGGKLWDFRGDIPLLYIIEIQIQVQSILSMVELMTVKSIPDRGLLCSPWCDHDRGTKQYHTPAPGPAALV